MVTESTIGKQIQLAFSKLGHRLFRMQSCMSWAGKAIHFSKSCTVTAYPGDVLIRKAFPIHSGIEGMSDYGGFTKEGRSLWVEVKTDKGTPSEAQLNFIEQVKKSNGIAGICRNVEDALRLLS